MAEIKIEKKSPIWPWILFIVAIIAILIYIFAFHGDGDETDDRYEDRTEQTTEDSAERRQVAPRNSTVASYVRFINEDSGSMGLDHEYSHEALSKLTNATLAMADEIDYDVQRDIDEARTHTNKITSDPYETNHANAIKKSAEILANVLQNIQQKAFPGLASEANQVKNTATAIETEEHTLDQRGDVKNFFRSSADLLEKMNNNTPQM